MENWFNTDKLDKYVYLIRERLDIIDKRFLTEFTNIYVIVGIHSAILFDTGSGVEKIKPVVEKIIKNRELIVINSHKHFDHILGNNEFDKIYIHENDMEDISKPIDISFLSYKTENYIRHQYMIPNATNIIGLKGGERFDLGGIEIEVIHTPGHTKGSISLFSDLGHLFTADTIHYGSIYLPEKDQMQTYLNSIDKLKNLINIDKIYTGHGLPQVDMDIFDKLEFIILKNYNNGVMNHFLESRIIKTEEFTLVIPDTE